MRSTFRVRRSTFRGGRQGAVGNASGFTLLAPTPRPRPTKIERRRPACTVRLETLIVERRTPNVERRTLLL
jgi:hypothetical protein